MSELTEEAVVDGEPAPKYVVLLGKAAAPRVGGKRVAWKRGGLPLLKGLLQWRR